MADIQRRKTRLRSDLRQRRNTLNSAQQDTAAQALIHSVVTLPNWASAQRIALYLATDGEIDTRALENTARGLAKEIFYPLSLTAVSALRSGMNRHSFHPTDITLRNRQRTQFAARHQIWILFFSPLWDGTGTAVA